MEVYLSITIPIIPALLAAVGWLYVFASYAIIMNYFSEGKS